jgi:hypothetical protein
MHDWKNLIGLKHNLIIKPYLIFLLNIYIFFFLMTNFIIILIELKKNFFCEHMIGKILLANGQWGLGTKGRDRG